MVTSVFPCEYSAMDGNLGGKSLPRPDVAWVDAYLTGLVLTLARAAKENGWFKKSP
jgi:hypothetical protein